MSALYQSKVAAVETSQKQEMDPSVRRPKSFKMTEDSKDSKSKNSQTHLTGDPSQHTAKSPEVHTTNTIPTVRCQHLLPTPPSKEALSTLYQQRQKSELKRILKHTCPELSSVDRLVEEELADACESASSTAEDIEYQGEVLSRRLIFENCTPLDNNIGDNSDNSKAYLAGAGRALVEGHRKAALGVEELKTGPQSNHSRTPGTHLECSQNQVKPHTVPISDNQSEDPADNPVEEESVVRADVRAARMMFESPKALNPIDNLDNASAMRVIVADEERGAVRKQMKMFNSKNQDVKALQPKTYGLFGPALTSKNKTEPRPNKHQAIQCHNNEQGQSQPSLQNQDDEEEMQCRANVKDRANLFESTPFHKINCRDGVDTVDVKMNGRLMALYNFSVIHSNGIVIESIESETAIKASYILTEGSYPKIQREEIITGNMKNVLLQILPRSNLTSCVNFIQEDKQGNVEKRKHEVPVHQLPFTANQDREYRTINLVQIVEELLCMVDSFKRGVIIQETANHDTEVTVYSLFSREEEQAFKCSKTGEEDKMVSSFPQEVEEEVKGDVKGAIRSLFAGGRDQNIASQSKLEEGVRGNVKLFRSCIEKGDLEYLKSLQRTPSEEDVNSPTAECENADQEDSVIEMVPGNVKNIRNLFSNSSDKQTPIFPHGKKVKALNKVDKSASNAEVKCPLNEVKNTDLKDENKLLKETHDLPPGSSPAISVGGQATSGVDGAEGDLIQHGDDLVMQPDMSTLTPGCSVPMHADITNTVEDDFCNLQAAIVSLQKATMEAKALQYSIQEKQEARKKEDKTCVGERDSLIEKDIIKHCETQQPDNCLPINSASLPPPNQRKSEARQETSDSPLSEDQTFDKTELFETIDKSNLTMMKVDLLQNTNTSVIDNISEIPPPHEKVEVVKGTIEAALKSLGESSFNTAQGDFKAAMIYRNAGKSYEAKRKTENQGNCIQYGDELGAQPEVSTSTPSCSVALEQKETATKSTQQSEITTSKQCKAESSLNLDTKEKQVVKSKTSKKKGKKAQGPKPSIPPKPDHLKAKPTPEKENISLPIETPEKDNTVQTETDTGQDSGTKRKGKPKSNQAEPMSYKDALCKGIPTSPNDSCANTQHASDSSGITDRTPDKCVNDADDNMALNSSQQDAIDISEQPIRLTDNEAVDKNVNCIGTEKQMDISVSSCVDVAAVPEANSDLVVQNFGPTELSVSKTRPVKPQRMNAPKQDARNAKLSKSQQCHDGVDSSAVNDSGKKSAESSVVMRKKKVRKESEEERLQRLSVQRDDIMKGNEATAKEIFENLRKQEELRVILSKVEEIEHDTSQVDVKALRQVFENVPDWIKGTPKKIKTKKVKTDIIEEKCESPTKAPEMSSMELAFGDLEKASAAILNLKEQTMAKLVDIEEAIRKALLSVSTLKSESDIAGLSGLFRESLVSAQASSSLSNISKISIGSSKSQKMVEQKKQAVTTNQSSSMTMVKESPNLELPLVKQRAISPSSSPSFISIESGVKRSQNPPTSSQQPGPKPERFQTTKELIVNSSVGEESSPAGKKNECSFVTSTLSAMDNPFNQSDFNAAKVQQAPKDKKGKGKRTKKGNSEGAKCQGNELNPKTSPIVTQQDCQRTETIPSKARSEVTTYPKVNLPSFREDRPPF